MKIGIVGSGAMGSVYGALLADAGNELWLLDRWREHIEAMRARGLRCQGASGDRTVEVRATTDAAEAGPLRARDRRHQGHGHRGCGARCGADDRAGQPGARDPERPRQCRAHPEGAARRQPAVRHRRRLRRRDRGAGPRPSQRHGGDQPRRALRRHLGAPRAGRCDLARGGLHGQPVRRPLAGGVEQAGRERRASARSAR